MSGLEMDLLTARRREGDASNGRTQTRENQDNSLYMRNCASLSSQRLIQLISISLDFLLFSFNNLIIRFGCFQDLKGDSSANMNNFFHKNGFPGTLWQTSLASQFLFHSGRTLKHALQWWPWGVFWIHRNEIHHPILAYISKYPLLDLDFNWFWSIM